ncbi:MAG: DUF3276 family protein [Bacteroidales bacterium]|jgi:hypothetical protein|nr:DUF3276 family protein [Bacteroidales bacterium]
MDNSYSKGRRDDIYSQAIRAGRRTYFLDVKSTKSEELYLTITESKRNFNNDLGKFQYEKHKLFLFKEDFEKFTDGLKDVIKFIENGQSTDSLNSTEPETDTEDKNLKIHSDISFEDLD